MSRPIDAVFSVVRSQCHSTARTLSTVSRIPTGRPLIATGTQRTTSTRTLARSLSKPTALFHTTPCRPNTGDEPRPPTDFASMDVLANTPVPSTAIDICQSDGFHLNSGAKILEGAGVILVGGEAFEWRPWLPRGEHRLLNSKGQWDIANEALGPLSLLWPRPGAFFFITSRDNLPDGPAQVQNILLTYRALQQISWCWEWDPKSDRSALRYVDTSVAWV